MKRCWRNLESLTSSLSLIQIQKRMCSIKEKEEKGRVRRSAGDWHEVTQTVFQTALRRDGAASAPPVLHLFVHFFTAQRSSALPRTAASEPTHTSHTAPQAHVSNVSVCVFNLLRQRFHFTWSVVLSWCWGTCDDVNLHLQLFSHVDKDFALS